MQDTEISDTRPGDDADILYFDIADAALEAAACTEGQGQVTEKFTAFGVDNCLMC